MLIPFSLMTNDHISTNSIQRRENGSGNPRKDNFLFSIILCRGDIPKNPHSWDFLYPLMCFLRLESFFSGHLQTFWKESCALRQQLSETLSGNPKGQNYFHNNTTTSCAFFTLILSWVHSGVFQRLDEMWCHVSDG